MLIEFTVGNFRSIKEPITLSMVATNLVAKNKSLDEDNTIKIDDELTLLKSAAIYGANASGKSNLARALAFMRDFVLNSSREKQRDDKILIERYRLSTETESKPAFFQIVFLLDGTKYRYGFEVTPEKVTAEWLFFVPSSKEARQFEREDSIKVSEKWFREGKGIEGRTRPNALFLSVVAQFNGEIAGKILTWFRRFSVNLGSDNARDLSMATYLFHRGDDKGAVLRFVKDLDLGIRDIYSEPEMFYSPDMEDTKLKELFAAVERIVGASPPKEIPKIRTVHQKYDHDGNAIGHEVFNLDNEESAGTARLFSLAPSILAALEAGHALFIDELDARLHPLITCAIIELFNSEKGNPKNAQLIFTTHDTNLLSNKRFRRDQIWFVEKDRFGATHLYSLAEFKIRNDASFQRDYILGKYGAIPFITGDLQSVVGGAHAEK